MLQPVSANPIRLADAVFDRMSDAIIDGTLEPGERLRDAELARTMGVSRMPVREALQRLERIGLVEMSPSRYTRVTEVTPELVASTLEFAAHYRAMAAALAVARMTAGQRGLATSHVEDAIARAARGADVSEVLATLHAAFIEACGNEFVKTLAGDADLAITRNLHGVEITVSADDLTALRDAIAAADAPAAEALVRAQFATR
ncbi:GntR family transcriptional regulator [Microbacterium indicum]|uniref:GntR family transcriptional regulator n=1 Tax=Microbacterium indicum TaxID=358100 RepID=UPI000411FB1A|nr:GntR family transcriptional regulator [Microbacterium indicum]